MFISTLSPFYYPVQNFKQESQKLSGTTGLTHDQASQTHD